MQTALCGSLLKFDFYFEHWIFIHLFFVFQLIDWLYGLKIDSFGLLINLKFMLLFVFINRERKKYLNLFLYLMKQWGSS